MPTSHAPPLTGMQLAADLLGQLSARSGYDERGYLFTLAAVEYLQQRFTARRHVTGAELAWACRDLALERFGLLARPVLEHWGILATKDFGRIVFDLVGAGLLVTQPDDRPEDFLAVYDFGDAFGGPYIWAGLPGD